MFQNFCSEAKIRRFCNPKMNMGFQGMFHCLPGDRFLLPTKNIVPQFLHLPVSTNHNTKVNQMHDTSVCSSTEI
ncbi:hypothetical protein Hanom_Chr05g00475541 [Helianthus anomalus]